MANYCDYRLAVAGRRANVDEFVRVMQNNYDKEHMFRVFEAAPYDAYDYGMYRKIYVEGYCAWSVYCCMLPGPYSYYNQWLEEKDNTKWYNKENNNLGKGTTLLELSQRLSLVIEVYSTEPGMCFCELYKIVHGKLVTDLEGWYQELWIGEPGDYKDYNEWAEDVGYNPDNEKVEMNEQIFNEMREDGEVEVHAGEFEFPDSIPEKPNYMVMQVMITIPKENSNG